ncbi:MAG: ATP-binding protein [Desulfobacterales bacterium]|nr:ATP-binding protein [Desulfobacterales bacterium]
MNPGTLVSLTYQLKELNLSSMAKHIESHIRQAKETGMSYEEFLLLLTDLELQMRTENRYKRKLKEAKFPLIKSLAMFYFEESPDLDMRLIQELATGEFIKAHKNVIFLGRSGTGKTHLSTALGIEACKQDFRTRFITGYGLVNELIEARKDKEFSRVIQKYSRYDLLILDELGYVPFSKEGAELLFQVLAERHERGSVMITTNLGFGDWTQIFGDPTMTAALLDRLTHKAHIITCSWNSYRLKETLKGK